MYQQSCKILNIKIGSSDAEIKRAFRKLAIKYHPDVSDKPQTVKKFIEINRAYKYLSEPEAYTKFINRHHQTNKPKENSHTYKSTYDESMAYKKKKEENLPDPPYYIDFMVRIMERFYDYIIILLGLFLTIVSPVYYIFDEEYTFENIGIMPIIMPTITGIALTAGMFYYMISNNHIFAIKVKMFFHILFGTK